MHAATVDFVVVAALGALVGAGELVSRYQDAPAGALRSAPALFYIALNIAASVVALAVIRAFHWKFGITSEGAALRWTQVGLAGTGAMALFRTSLFTVHAGDRDIGIGPSSFLQIFREAADRAVDRLRAASRGRTVSKLMEGISYDKAAHGLTTYCLALMQNVSDEEQVALTKSLALLDAADIDPAIKVRILGLNLLNVVGPNVLIAAVNSLRKEMTDPSKPTAPVSGPTPPASP
ncbi:MAG: hypothetical protein ACRD3D_09765 [Terriglobia bacterium]